MKLCSIEYFVFTASTINDRSPSPADVFVTNLSRPETRCVENIFKNINIVLLQKHFDRNIFHQNYWHDDNFPIGYLQVLICITEIYTFDEYLDYAQTCERIILKT
jgi:hypothetical protein